MANARHIVKRRKAVTNIRKITKTMQLIATARFQQAFNRAMATKPYTKKITQLVSELAAAGGGQLDHPLMKKNETTKDVVLVLTSNRGLCGGYNAGLVRKAMEHLNRHTERNNEIHVVGKKGIAYFKFIGRKIGRAITSIDDRPRFEQVEPIATELMQRYEAGEIGNVYVVYMRFISTGRQVPEVMQLLPLTQDAIGVGDATAEPAGAQAEIQYDFSPEPVELLKKLLPQTVKVRLYQCFTDMAVSEQVARMVAMKAATDAAGDMIKSLSRQYNRARQTQITMELLDIVGGAEALK
ncbi:MAG: ATP synthase F1 subunit gamma [Planctomycetes bacterium]|nr:ATP synthase F1 subunit gamma [Planctomycetota bacterium]